MSRVTAIISALVICIIVCRQMRQRDVAALDEIHEGVS